jgi:hypothetical protein
VWETYVRSEDADRDAVTQAVLRKMRAVKVPYATPFAECDIMRAVYVLLRLGCIIQRYVKVGSAEAYPEFRAVDIKVEKTIKVAA